jgi:hypothetical protein
MSSTIVSISFGPTGRFAQATCTLRSSLRRSYGSMSRRA